MDHTNIKLKLNKLIDSKPTDPDKLPEWWASWHALGDMVTASPSSAEKEEDERASSSAKGHWNGWWNAQGPPELPGGEATEQKVRIQ